MRKLGTDPAPFVESCRGTHKSVYRVHFCLAGCQCCCEVAGEQSCDATVEKSCEVDVELDTKPMPPARRSGTADVSAVQHNHMGPKECAQLCCPTHQSSWISTLTPRLKLTTAGSMSLGEIKLSRGSGPERNSGGPKKEAVKSHKSIQNSTYH